MQAGRGTLGQMQDFVDACGPSLSHAAKGQQKDEQSLGAFDFILCGEYHWPGRERGNTPIPRESGWLCFVKVEYFHLPFSARQCSEEICMADRVDDRHQPDA